jgi:LysR family transcriptional regulator for metE and metH
MAAVMAIGHPLAKRPYIERADLSTVRTMAVPGETCAEWPDGAWRVPLVDLMVELARLDLGIALLPMWMAGSAVHGGAVAARRLTRDGIFRHWRLAHRDEETPGYVSTFIEALVRRPPSAAAHFAAHRAD